MKKIIEKLNQDGTRFTIKGITLYRGGAKPFKVRVSEYGSGMKIISVEEDDMLFGKSMSVEKYGPTCMWLFSYDMFERKSTFKIKYKDVTLIEE